jgi:predicted AAA+ superfamily ATPase
MLDGEAARLVPAQYLDTLASSIARKHEVNEYRLRRLLTSLARNIGQAVTYDTVANDMVEGDIKDKRETANRQQVEKLISMTKDRFIIEDQCGWDAPVRSKSRVRIKPVRRFVDPSLPASLLGVNEERLLSDFQLFGKLFEELCLRDLRIYASAMELSLPDPVRYYRDSDNLEVDAIIELRDGRWAALEVKLGENKTDEGVTNLLRLKEKVAANPLERNPEPSFMAVIVGKLEFCRKTPEGVYVIPITSLTA